MYFIDVITLSTPAKDRIPLF